MVKILWLNMKTSEDEQWEFYFYCVEFNNNRDLLMVTR